MGKIAIAVKHLLTCGASADAVVAAIAELEETALTGAERTKAWRDRCDATSPTSPTSPTSQKEKVSHTLPKENTTSDFPSENLSPRNSGTNPRALKTNPRNQTPETVSWMKTFEDFWLIYPRKLGKGAARKAYRMALNRASPEDIAAGARRYAVSCRDPQFTKHPATWLNADCWLDEPQTPAVNGRYASLAFKKTDAVPDPPTPEERQRRLEIIQHLKVKRA